MTDSNNTPFDKNDNDTTPPTGEPSSNPFEDKLKAIKNDKGEPKYKDIESALEALEHSQQFIETLKTEKSVQQQELEDARKELEKRQSVEDIVNNLTKNDQDPEPKADPHNDSGLDEEKVLNLVNQALEKQRQSSQAEQNLNNVISKLSEAYGDNTKKAIEKVASDIGSTADELKKLSMSNPKLVLSLFRDVKVEGENQPSHSSNTPPRGTPPVEAPKPTKSIMKGGASNKEVLDLWEQNKQYTYKQLGVEN